MHQCCSVVATTIDRASGAAAHALPFFWQLERHGDRAALLTEEGEAISYFELARKADASVAHLSGRQLVLLKVQNTVDAVAAYLGALRGGHCVLMVPAEIASDRLEALCNTFNPSVCLDSGKGFTSNRICSQVLPELHPDLSLLLSTSGSTGSSKLVRLSSGALQANAASIAEYLTITREDCAITSLPIHYSYGLSVLNSHLLVGASIAITERSVVEGEFREFLDRVGATSLAGVPYTFELLERASFRSNSPASIRYVTQAGGRLSPELAADYARWAGNRGVRFYTMYGQTEATARMAYMPPESLLDYPECIGIAIPGGDLRLVDESGAEITEPDVEGELVYRGPNVMMGYATAAADLALPAQLDELRTGDLAKVNVAGFYRIVGRRSRFIKPFGVRVGLDDVEALLCARGHVAVAAGNDDVLAVRLIGEGGDEVSVADELAAVLHLPLTYVDVSSSPERLLLPSGKTDYASVLQAALARRTGAASAELGSVKNVFVEHFPRQHISTDSSFVRLGGDSLSYVGVSIALERLLGNLPVRWEESSVAELERLLPAQPRRAPRWWQLRSIESEVAIRAAAITGVVTLHATSSPVSGGANILLMLFGYNLSRYQYDRLTSGRAFELLANFFSRIILPYLALLTLYCIAKQEFDWTWLLLVSNYEGRFRSSLEPFWFLESLLQTIIAISLIFTLSKVQRAVAGRPWEIGIGVLIASLALASILNTFVPRPELRHRTPELLLWLVALGWCLHRATSLRRQLVITVFVTLILLVGYLQQDGLELGFPNVTSQRIWFLAACLLIMWIPRLLVPGIVHGIIATIAAASFYIYLVHIVAVHICLHILGLNSPLLTVSVGLLSGVAFWGAIQIRPAIRRAILPGQMRN